MLQTQDIKTSISKENLDIVQSLNDVFNDIKNHINVLNPKELLGTYLNEYNKSLSATEQLTKNIAREFGGIRDIGLMMKENIDATTFSAQVLGITQQELINNQTNLVQGLHTATILNQQDLLNLSAAAKLFGQEGISNSEFYNNMIPSLLNVGTTFDTVNDKALNIINYAKEYGTSVSAVYGLVQQNISKINEFSFENGVEGLTKMAADSASMRVDLFKISEGLTQFLNVDKMQQ